MKRILVAVDGSESSLRGVRMAAEISASLGARLELVHVSLPNLLPAQIYPDLIATLEENEKKEAEAILTKAGAEATAGGATFEKVHLTGSPAEVIADLAEYPSVKMVVVGSRGRGAVKRVLLGSTADRLVHVCKAPVLVVR